MATTGATKRNAGSYREVMDEMRQRIVGGTWREGERLPTLAEASRQFGVNYNTMLRAINELQREGYVETRGRNGCFVSQAWLSQPATAANGQERDAISRMRVGVLVYWNVEEPGVADPGMVLFERLLASRLYHGGGSVRRVYIDRHGRSPVTPELLAGEPDIQALVVHSEVQLGSLLPRIQELPIRLVGYFRTLGINAPFDTVRIDDGWACGHAVDHLVQQGHVGIAFAGLCAADPQGVYWQHQRLLGYREAMARHQLADHARELGLEPPEIPDDSGRAIVNDQQRHGFHLAALLDPSRQTAVVCCNDNVALGLIAGLRQRGMRVPDDVAVIGYDNQGIDAVQRELTTFTIPDQRVVEAILTLLAQRLAGTPEIGDRADIILRPIFVPRSSSRFRLQPSG